MGWPVTLDPIQLYRGDSRKFTFKFWADDAKTVPVDLTAFGTVFAAQVRHDPDLSVLVALTMDTTAAATGVLSFTIPPTAWADLPFSALGWDIQVSAGDGSSVTTLVAGTFQVVKDFTHA